MRRADALGARMRSDHEARMEQGPSASPGDPLEEGNIEHRGRAEIDNHDGTKSTVRSMSFHDGPGREVLIPTAYDGALHSDEDSIDNYRKTQQHMGVFRYPQEATQTAIRVHNDYEQGRYKKPPPPGDAPVWLSHYMKQEGAPARAQGGAMQPKGLASSIARDLRKTKRAC
jgi:hypothetical protein